MPEAADRSAAGLRQKLRNKTKRKKQEVKENGSKDQIKKNGTEEGSFL